MGQYDQVLFRIEALPLLSGQPHQIVALYQFASSSGTSWPFRVRSTQVRVVRLDGDPAENAQVYRLTANQIRDGALFPPQTPGRPQLTTDSQGYLKGHDVLTPTDRLMALAPISTTDTYTLYFSSAVPTPTGLDLYQIRSSGVQTLTVSPKHPLILFNLKVSLEWDARADNVFHTQLEANLKRASELLFRWSGGQVALGTIQIFNNREHWNDAHIRLYATNRMRPSANQGGITSPAWPEGLQPGFEPRQQQHFYARGQLRIGAAWDRFGNPQAGVGEDWALALAHELGHYALFLNDNYLGYYKGRLVSVDTCPGPMADPYRDTYGGFRASADWLPSCEFTLSQQENGRADWTTIKTFYDSPSLGFYLNEALRVAPATNPRALPVAVTRVLFSPAFADPNGPPLSTPIVVLSNTDGGPFTSSSGLRAVLYQDAQVIDLGVPKEDQLLARGAHPGDRVCVYALSQQRMGCQKVEDNYVQLMLQPMDGWHPDMQVTPLTSGTLQVSVQNLPAASALSVQLYPIDGPALPPSVLAPDGAGGFQATVVVSNALVFEGMVRIWEGTPHIAREVVQDVRVGSNPGPMFRRARGAPVLSADGQAILYTNAITLTEGQFFTLQATDSAPPPPVWANPVSRAYRLTASPELNLTGSSLNIGYLSQDVPQGQEKGIRVAWWDAAAKQWRVLETDLDTDHHEAIVSITQPGIYMLLTRTTIPLTRYGWNLVYSYPGATQAVKEALTTIDGQFTSVYGYDAQDPSNPWRLYDRFVREPWASIVNDLESLRTGEGYWIYATEPGSWFVRGGAETPSVQSDVPLVPPPATYYGVAPSVGLTLDAWVGSTHCGSTYTSNRMVGQVIQAVFVIRVRAAGDGSPDCGSPGRPITLIFRDGPREVRRITTGWDNRWAHQIPFPTYLPTVRR